MTPLEFVLWMQGVVDTNPAAPSQEVWNIVYDKIGTVDTKSPSYPYLPNPPPIFGPIPRTFPGVDQQILCGGVAHGPIVGGPTQPLMESGSCSQ